LKTNAGACWASPTNPSVAFSWCLLEVAACIPQTHRTRAPWCNATDAAADFYQLPAINGKFRLRDNAPTPLPTAGAEPYPNVKKFIPIDVSEFCALAFVSHVWLEAKFECVELKKM